MHTQKTCAPPLPPFRPPPRPWPAAVLGNAKNVVAAAVSVAVFHNPVTAQGLGGYGVTVAGVAWYSHCVKKHKAQVGGVEAAAPHGAAR